MNSNCIFCACTGLEFSDIVDAIAQWHTAKQEKKRVVRRTVRAAVYCACSIAVLAVIWREIPSLFTLSPAVAGCAWSIANLISNCVSFSKLRSNLPRYGPIARFLSEDLIHIFCDAKNELHIHNEPNLHRVNAQTDTVPLCVSKNGVVTPVRGTVSVIMMYPQGFKLGEKIGAAYREKMQHLGYNLIAVLDRKIEGSSCSYIQVQDRRTGGVFELPFERNEDLHVLFNLINAGDGLLDALKQGIGFQKGEVCRQPNTFKNSLN